MTDWRGMFDRDLIGSWDLDGRDVTVSIARVEAKELVAQGGRKSKKPVVWFEGKEKAFCLNKTNAKIIATLYGNDTRAWVGKKITIYPTKTQMGGETVDCIRVRPAVPSTRGRKAAPAEAAPAGDVPGVEAEEPQE